MISKRADGKWFVDIQPGGRTGPRLKRVFKTQGEAKAFERWAQAERQQKPDWVPEKKDSRRLSDLVDLWAAHHAPGLKSADGAESRLRRMVESMRNPLWREFSGSDFAEYRETRLAQGISRNTVNHEHAYLRSVISECMRLGFLEGVNPLQKVRQFKVDQTELSYLTAEQIQALFCAIQEGRNPHTGLVARVCLATGARWSEAEGLRIHQVRDGMVTFSGTKSGKNRAVPVTDAVELEIHSFHAAHGVNEYVFQPCYSSFRSAVERAGLQLPKGQLSHVLRHTFASHFMMNGGNILALQRLLGHASLTMTMKYAHLAPDHLEEARRLNPLSALGL